MTAIIPAQTQVPSTFTLDDLERMARYMAASKLFGVNEPTQAIALMLIAQAEGEHPATIAQDYDIIQGRAARKTHSVLARFQRAGGKVEWHELSDEKAEATFSHPSGGKVRIDWDIARAKQAGLAGKDNYRKFARAMLRARCIGEGVRAVYPAALGGMRMDADFYDLNMEPVPDLSVDDVPVKPEIQMPKAKAEAKPVEAAVIETPVTAKQMDAPSVTVGKDENTFEGTATEKAEAPKPAILPVETPAVDEPLASPGSKVFLSKKLGDRDPVAFAAEHGADWNHLTVSAFQKLKDALK